MNLDRFVLGTYELELLGGNEIFRIANAANDYGISYFDTSICYNNDYILKDTIPCNWKCISKIPPQMTSKYAEYLEAHLYYLGRDHLDIGLIHNPRADWVQLAKLMEHDDRIYEVGVSNFNVTDLIKYKEVFGYYPSYNEIEINPSYLPIELIEFCKDAGIKLIAYAIFGGKYNAVRTISDFTLPSILNQVLGLADLAILRVDNVPQLAMAACVDESFVDKYSIHYEFSKKSIEPMNYKLPINFNAIKLAKKLIPTYSKCLGVHENNYLVDTVEISKVLEDYLTEFYKSIKNDRFEFITDYRVALRYYLHDKLGKLNLGLKFNYFHDILIIQSNYCTRVYNIYLCKDGNLTKINEGNNTEIRVVSDLIEPPTRDLKQQLIYLL